jgi:uncharacterized protein (DUF1684 family)
MKYFLGAFAILVVFSCGGKKESLQGETEFQRTMNANFKDATKSPLTDKDRKKFTSLDFFPFDSTYVVTAHLERTPDSEYFNMKTTTDRLAKERVYGILTFEIQEQEFKLNVYQSKESLTTEGYQDYLFLPFLDDTNGESTYGGGRYIDLRIPEGNLIIIDFNKAYNPLCAYNEKYSCPIVPRLNYLSTEVKAGLMNYDKKN